MSHVVCHETFVSPAPPPGFTAATGLKANELCGAECKVGDELAHLLRDGAVAIVRCPHGHQFYATGKNLQS